MSLPTRPTPRDGILSIDAYVPGKSAALGAGKVHKLSSNETPLGPSPRAVEAFKSVADRLELYPDGSARILRDAIGRRYDIDPARVVCGNGSDDVLHLLAGIYVGPGDEGIYTEHGFLVYRIAILAAGGAPVVAPETDLTANVDAILERVTERTKIVYIANPNNPTGTYLPISEVERLRAGMPSTAMLVIDAAYGEYVGRNDYSTGLEMVAKYDNVVMTRTFSKIHGLAALRIGWAYAPEPVCDALNRVRAPFNLNTAAIAAGVAALDDADHVKAAAAHNDKWLPWLAERISRLDYRVTPSVANFVLIHFPDEPGRSALDADRFLSERGLVLRNVAAYGLPNALRMTVGTEEANRLVVDALAEFAAGSGKRG